MVFLYFTYPIIKFHTCLLSRKVKNVTDIQNCIFTPGQRIPRTEGYKDSLCQCPIACRWVLMEKKNGESEEEQHELASAKLSYFLSS